MKKFLIPLVVVLVLAFIITGCSSGSTTTSTTSTTKPTTTTTTTQPTTTTTQPTSTTTQPTTSTTTSTSTTPSPGVYGGTLTIVYASGPTALSYVPAMGPTDHSLVFPAAENLVEATAARETSTGVEPWLCESVDDNPQALTITWHLRKGVMFHDGTEMTATDVQWNFQVIIDAKALPHAENLKSMQVVDKYTLVMNLNSWSNQLMPDWGYWPVVTSKTAYDKAAGGDAAKGKDFLTNNIVGTGPFMLKEYKRDDHITWVKNPNYWIKGRPYLDGIEVKIIPDPVTAQTLMLAQQADIWANTPASAVSTLEKSGMKRQSGWPRLPYGLWPNTGNPNSKMADIKVRSAVEYAINKDAVAKSIGFGIYKGLPALPMSGEWGYDPNYNPRPYDPAKARQLLIDAGKTLPFKINLLTLNDPVTRDIGTALKQMLDAAGFSTNLDVADPGRFFGSTQFVTPTADQDLMWWITGGMDNNYLSTYFRWFSSTPFTNYTFLGRTQQQIDWDKQAAAATTVQDQQKWTAQLMRYLGDNALIIPVWEQPAFAIQQPWVHSDEYTKGFTRWDTQELWMDKH
jgi:peptide/nickel transport system substrate-binding protein